MRGDIPLHGSMRFGLSLDQVPQRLCPNKGISGYELVSFVLSNPTESSSLKKTIGAEKHGEYGLGNGKQEIEGVGQLRRAANSNQGLLQAAT